MYVVRVCCFLYTVRMYFYKKNKRKSIIHNRKKLNISNTVTIQTREIPVVV